MVDKKDYTYTIKTEENNQYSIDIKVSSDYFKEAKEKVYNRLKSSVSIKGFRPGQAPQGLIEAKLGPTLYETTINEVLPQIAVEALKDAKINPVSQLNYHLHKVSEDDGIEFHVDFEGIGEINLPNFGKLGVKKEVEKVTNKEVDMVIQDMFERGQTQRQPQDKKAPDGKETKNKKESEKKTDGKESKTTPTDDWAKSIGIEGVKNLESLRKEVEKQLNVQKERMADESFVARLIDEAVKAAKITVPSSLSNRQLEAREDDYRNRIKQLGLKFEDFLKSKNTTLEELKKEWEEEIKKSIAREIMLIEIAKQNNIKVSQEEVGKELDAIQDENMKKQYNTESGKNYIATVMIQQRAVGWLRKQVEPDKQK